jgi:farnesyl diphosphate synthase
MRADFQSWVAARQSHFEEVLRGLLPRADVAPQRLHEAMRYAVLDGGKRIRPLLAFAGGELAGADAARLDIAAAAVELIHAYSLVHDDMPCMDNDVLRRGKPTCHVQYDEATALLVGDSLQTLAFQLLAEHRLSDDAQRQLDMIKLLAVATGSRGMAGGQAIDLVSVGKSLTLPELEFMHIHKTGALIRAAIILGASCGAEADPQLAPNMIAAPAWRGTGNLGGIRRFRATPARTG